MKEKVHTTKKEYGRATEVELRRLRAKIGQKVTINEPPHLTEVTRDSVRHWAHATGDRNPLFLDESYARASRHGGLIAPPCQLYAFSRISIGYRGGLPGVHSFFAGSHWRWHEPVRVGERIEPEVTFKDLIELPSRFAGRMFKQLSLIRFPAADGHELASAESWGMRVERVAARKKGKYNKTELAKPYTREQLEEIAHLYSREKCRGSDTLYFEDVTIGSSVPEIVRGPYTATTAVAFEQAWGGLFIKAHGYWFDYLRRHPAAGIPNTYNIPEPPEAVHWDTPLARSVGVPEAYDYGPERIAWLATMLTNWIGDDGFLSELYCEVRRFNLVGDLTYCRARVASREPQDGRTGKVKLDIEAVNQRGESTAAGWAVVKLPRRN
ncbi:MAG: MaoC family dehydratase N-terminal domain-containing protein [Betaproteobacteria bacterium]|nr:MaoC family dehydratase N-terminal domain-containing protein [Betaproteobacteria bacterium]